MKREQEPASRRRNGRGRAFSSPILGAPILSVLWALVPVAALLMSAVAYAQDDAAAKTESAAGHAEKLDLGDTYAEGSTIMPKAISHHARDIDRLFWGIFWLTGITFVIVEGLLVYILIKYRHREGKTKADHFHGSHKLEVFWTVGTALILITIAIVQNDTWSQMKKDVPDTKDALLIRCYGEQFYWYFNYPGADGKFEDAKPWQQNQANDGTKIGLGFREASNDVTLPGKLVVPAGVDVIIELNSMGKYVEADPDGDDPNAFQWTHPVLHSLFIPVLRLKQDLVPYNPGLYWFKVEPNADNGETWADVIGDYEIACAELCGEGHSLMRADFKVVAPEDFAKEVGYDYRTSPRPTEFPPMIHIRDRPPVESEDDE